MKLFAATKNAHKKIELERMLSPLGFTLVFEDDLETPFPDVEETGVTFKENALIKARAALQFTGMASVADDSGLSVDALGGEPGVYSARYSGVHGDDEANIKKVLTLLEGVPQEKRTAHFSSAVACVFPDGKEICVEGICEGYIADGMMGNSGFGYDPIFISSAGCFGLISPEEKDKVSHRGRALNKLVEELKKYNYGE